MRSLRLAALLSLAACTALLAADPTAPRTWTDKSGKFRIEAEFVSEEEGVVTLRKEDGEEVEVPLEKLSPADQKAAREAKAAAEDNPFQSKGAKEKSPFASKGKGSPAPKGTRPRNGGEKGTAKGEAKPDDMPEDRDDDAAGAPKAVKVDWSGAALVAPGSDGEWKVEVGAPIKGLPRPRTTALPGKSNFFEGMTTLAIAPDGKHAAVGYLLGEPKPDGTCRIVIADLETGKGSPVAVTTGQMGPMALHDDGQHLLMRREEFGFGNHDRLEIWRVAGGKIRKLRSFIPYPDAGGGSRDIVWARFLDGSRFATAGNGELAIWRFPELEPICRLPVAGPPAVSPDGKRIAWCDGKNVGLLDIESQEVIAQQPTPAGLFNPQLAFSPSGKRLACISQQKLLVWDVASGAVLQDMDVPTIHIFTGIAFPDDDWVLGGNQYLIGVGNGLLLWTYSGQQQVATHGPWTFFGTLDGEKSGALVPLKIPHSAAEALLKKASTDPNLFILREGTKVRLELNAITDVNEREKAAAGLTKQLAAIGCTPSPEGTISLVAGVSGPVEKTLELRNSGDYKVQEWVTSLQFVHEGKPVWQTQSTNVPGGPVIFFNLEEGENIGTWLKKREKPDYGLFERAQLPRFLQRPSAGSGPNGSLTLGTSQVTPAGLR